MQMIAVMLGLVSALCWGLHDLAVRRIAPASNGLGPNVLGQILVVMAVATVVLLPFGGAGVAGLSGTSILYAALAGVAYVAASVGMYRAFGLAPARVVSPMLAAYPLLSLLIASAQGQAITASDWAAVVIIVAGVCVVALLAQDEGAPAGSARAALIWAAIGSAGFAVTFAFGQAASQGDAPLSAGLVTRFAALAVILTLIMVQRPSMQPVRRHWRLLLVMGVLDTAALGLVMVAGGYPRAEFASVAASLFGVVTILLAWAVLGERVRGPQWLGIGLVFGGIGWLAL